MLRTCYKVFLSCGCKLRRANYNVTLVSTYVSAAKDYATLLFALISDPVKDISMRQISCLTGSDTMPLCGVKIKMIFYPRAYLFIPLDVSSTKCHCYSAFVRFAFF